MNQEQKDQYLEEEASVYLLNKIIQLTQDQEKVSAVQSILKNIVNTPIKHKV
jgi:hypothetical protein